MLDQFDFVNSLTPGDAFDMGSLSYTVDYAAQSHTASVTTAGGSGYLAPATSSPMSPMSPMSPVNWQHHQPPAVAPHHHHQAQAHHSGYNGAWSSHNQAHSFAPATSSSSAGHPNLATAGQGYGDPQEEEYSSYHPQHHYQSQGYHDSRYWGGGGGGG